MVSMVNMMQRMEDISVAARSDTYSANELNIFAIEVEGYMDDIRGLQIQETLMGTSCSQVQRLPRCLSLKRQMVVWSIRKSN